MGADMIVLITNDSWFSNSAEAEAHASQAVLRAIETGLPVVRVGNSGVTGVVRPDGTANWLSDSSGRLIVDERGVMVETVVVQARDR
jgi:apolipoprotein N-acyltransferase